MSDASSQESGARSSVGADRFSDLDGRTRRYEPAEAGGKEPGSGGVTSRGSWTVGSCRTRSSAPYGSRWCMRTTSRTASSRKPS